MTPDPANPVFIVGGSRTGSTMLRSILCSSDEIDIVSELLLLCPRWLHKDFNSIVLKSVGDLESPTAKNRLLQLLYSGDYHDRYWGYIKRNIDREELRDELATNVLNIRNLLRAIMVVNARKRGKSRIGAKFPMHYSYTHKLLEWFPKCQILHTTRNPKAVYASQSAKYSTAEMSLANRTYSRIQQFAHINIQTTLTARLHSQLKRLTNYRLIRYEDIVRDPENTLRGMCEQIGISLSENMLNPNQFGSSFESIGGGRRGIDDSSLERWRSTISPATALAMDAVHLRANWLLGYGSGTGSKNAS